MIRSVVTRLLLVLALGLGVLATVQLSRTCETTRSAWDAGELVRCVVPVPAASARVDADPTGLPGPTLQPRAFRAPTPILLVQNGDDPELRTGHEDPRDDGIGLAAIHTSVPRPRDEAEVRRLLAHHYPTALASAGTGGMVVLSLLISPDGLARASEVVSGSGVAALDDAALEVARRVRFTPAAQQGRTVEARILFPVVFEPS
jgi:TonB family protein